MTIYRDDKPFELTPEEMRSVVKEIENTNYIEEIKAFFAFEGIEIDDKAAGMFLDDMQKAHMAAEIEKQGFAHDYFAKNMDEMKKELVLTKETTESLYPEFDDGFDAALDNAMKAIDDYQKKVEIDKDFDR